MTSTTGMPAFGHHRARRLGVFETRHDQTGGSPGQHLVDHVFFVVGIVFRRPDHRLQRRVVQHRPDAAKDVGKHHVAERRDHHAHEVHPVRRQRACDLVGHIAQRRAAANTRSRVFSDTSPRWRNTRLTVISDTPAASATSRKRHLGLAVEGIASAQIGVPEQRRRPLIRRSRRMAATRAVGPCCVRGANRPEPRHRPRGSTG
jgi:hypothetical protein